MNPWRVVPAALLIVLSVVSLAWPPVSRYYHSAHLLAALAKPADAAAPATEPAIEEIDLEVPRDTRMIRARIYRIVGSGRSPGVVVAHGVHYRGIDERRLVPFARALAREGLVILTPELRELADYRISEASTQDIAASIRYLSERADLVSDARVGVLGFSFAGGLALVAAEEPATARHLAWVLSIGGHHDLRRVSRFFVDDEIASPRGMEKRKAHEYGLIVLVYGNIGEFVPPEDEAAASDALRAWLKEDRELAAKEAQRCVSEACKHLFSLVHDGRAKELGPHVRELVSSHEAELARLSPQGRMRAIHVPVHLLHGSGDSVIPPTEAEWAAQELSGQDHTLLVSPLLEHVEVTKPAGWREKLSMVDFMAAIM